MNLQSFKNTSPIIYYEENLIFNDIGDCWGIYKIDNFDYELKKEEEKNDMLYGMTDFLSEAGEQLKLLIIPKISDNTERIVSLIERIEKLKMEDRIKKLAKDTIMKQAEYLIEKDEGGVNEYEVYLLINLKPKLEVLSFLKGVFNDPKKHLYELFGVDTFEISKTKLAEYKARSKDFLRRQLGRIVVKAVDDPEQIEKLIKRCFYRGIDDDVEARGGFKPKVIEKVEKVEPFSKDIATLCCGEFEVKNKIISITQENDETGEEETGYQTFLTVSYMPDNMIFPGNEFFSVVQYLDFPVEIIVNTINIEYESALKRIEKKRQALNSQIRHVTENDDYVPHTLLDASQAVEELEINLRGEKSDLTKATITFCVYANDKDVLKERVGRLKALYKEMKILFERPISDQELLFMQSLPGTGNYVRDFEIMLTSKTIAGGMPGATTKIGDNAGMYVGYTSNLMRPVFLSLLHACQINKSASAFVWGSLGYVRP